MCHPGVSQRGMMEDGLVRPVDEGTGGPLSPILSNLVLDDLDKELARRRSRLAHQQGSGACPVIRRSSKPYATPISSRSVFPESMRPPKPNSVEPPWYGPVCPVVWEGWRREASPYPDQRRIADVADLSLGRLNWADSPPTGAASGVTGTCGIVAVAFRGWTPEYSGRAPLIAPTYDYDTPWMIRRSQPA
jgi:hypothetical protein